MTDHEIIKGCIRNDRRCQNELYRKYYPLMSSIALRYCSDEDEARQGINYGFLKVLQGIDRYDQKYALATWIRNILVNHLVDEFRKQQTYRTRIQAESPFELEVGWNANLAEAEWEVEELRDILNCLPVETKRVFNLYAIDGYKHREIAKMLGISVGTSKWHVSDARKKLKRMLENRANHEKKRVEIESKYA